MKHKKKLVIRDQHGSRVLIESIAGWTHSDRQIKIYLRAGDKINLSWADRTQSGKAVRLLDKQFEILECEDEE